MSTTGSPPMCSPALMVTASSSVEQVSTLIDCSLSRAASTVFWCVSGTLRIHPRWSWRGGHPSLARAARASRKVSFSVSMISGAGMDSGIGASGSGSDSSRVALGVGVLHVAGGGPCHRLAVVARHHPQGHVDAGRDAGRGEDVAVLHHVQLLLDGDGGEGLAHPVE